MPVDPLDLAAIGGDLGRLAELLRKAQIQLPGVTRDEFEAERDEILLTFDGYLEPRIGAPDAPIVAAIVGQSGVGKSTLLNSIARARVSGASVVRPTTERPVVWADSGHSDDYWRDFSERAARHLGSRVDAHLVEDHVTEHLTLIDTPPLDRQGAADIAAQAVAISDLCIFVTSPSRYADGLAWGFLRRARSRGIPMLFVMNRLPLNPDEQEAVMNDFARRLHQRELLAEPDASLLFGIEEGEIDSLTEGLHPDAVAAIRKELAEVADPVYRSGLVDETAYATARMVAERARALTRPMAAEQPIINSLLEAVTGCYEREAAKLDTQLRSGALSVTNKPRPWPEVAAEMAGILARRAGAAAHAAASEWSRRPGPARLVQIEAPELWRHAPDTAGAARLSLDRWRDGLLPLARSHSRPGRLRWFGADARAVNAIWSVVVGAAESLPRAVQRKFDDEGLAVVETARAELSEALRASLAADAARFIAFLNSGSDGGLYESIIDRADALDARLDQLAGQIPRAWTEPLEDYEIVGSEADQHVTIEITGGATVIELDVAPPAPDPLPPSVPVAVEDGP
jgi:GTPase SAR1 family protein